MKKPLDQKPAVDSDEKPFETYLRENPPYTWADLEHYQPDSSTYLAGTLGWLRRGYPTALIGWSGQGKSILLEQICVQLSAGQDLFGKVKVFKPLKVLLIECENGKDVLSRDFRAIMKHTGADPRKVSKNLTIVSDWRHKDELFGPFLLELLIHCEPDLVCIDNLQGFMSTDPNKAENFNNWIDPVLHAIKAANCGLILVDHAPKPPKVGNTEKDLDLSLGAYLGSGTARKANWARTSFELINFTRDPRYRLNFSKSGQWAGIKDVTGKDTNHFFIEQSGISTEPYWKLADNQAAPVKGAKLSVDLAAFAQHLADFPDMSQDDRAEKLGLSRKTIQRNLKRLEAKKRGCIVLPKTKK